MKTSKKKWSWGKFGGIIAVLIFCIGLFSFNTGIFSRTYDTPVNRSQFPVIYTKNNTLCIKPLSKKTNNLSDYLTATPNSSPKVFMAKSGDAIYFLENYDDITKSGSMFASFDGKIKLPISSKAHETIQITADGKYALFAELPNLDTMTGTLYLYKKNSEKQKIADRVSINNFLFSTSGKSFSYIEMTENSTTGDLYFQSLTGDREKIDSNVSRLIFVTSDESAFYMKDTQNGKSELYYWRKNKTAALVSDNAFYNMVYTSKFSDNLFFCGDNTSPSSYSLYMKTKQLNKELIDTNVVTTLSHDATYQNIMYTKNFSQADFSYDTYIKRKGKKPVKLVSSSESSAPAAVSYDFNTVAYISDMNSETKSGKLYMQKFNTFNTKAPQLIAENVSSFKLSRDGSIILYNVQNTLYAYSNKKNVLISENVENENYMFSNTTNGVYYISNYNSEKLMGNLFFKKSNKLNAEPTKIDSDVSRIFYPRNDKQVIYKKNYNNTTGESDLYIRKNGKSELIDSGVIDVLCE